jgi:diguanylate cyclase (GGDEF)-like protein
MTTTSTPRRQTPLRLRVLIGVTCLAGLLVAGDAIAFARNPPSPFQFLAAIGIFALARIGTLRVSFGSERLYVGWGEVTLIVGMCLLPPNWLIPVVPIGALLGMMVAGRPTVKTLYNAAVFTIAAACGSAVTVAIADPTQVPPLTVRGAVALAAGAFVYWLVCLPFAVVAVQVARGGGRLRDLIFGNLGAQLLMLVSNLVLGLLAVGLGLTNFRYLAFAPPLLWLLYEVYQARIRAGAERRAWQELARAVHAMSKLDVEDVVDAAVTGAQRLFTPDTVEIVVDLAAAGGPGTRRRYLGRPSSPVMVVDGETDVGELAPAGPSRELAVDDTVLGELRLRYRRPVEFGERQQLAFSAYGDALAAALRNAASHTELRQMADRKAYEADRDALTGLASRTRLLERGEELLREAPETPGRQVALLLLDMNHFQDVNDTLGHSAGDQLLRSTAGALSAAVAEDELLARLGGDEFALLIHDLPAGHPPADAAIERGRMLAAAMAEPVEIAGVALAMEVSVGVVTVPAGGCVMAELLRRAEVAMYQAKRTGMQVVAYDPARDAASTDRLALLAEFREALAVDDQLVLQLQPAVDLATGGPTGVEALIRWQHPRRGWIGPGEFVPIVEQSDLVGPFTLYVLNAALTVAARWDAEGLDVPVAVNMSARSLIDRRLPDQVRNLLAKHQVSPQRLVLEITETAMMTELEIIDGVLAELREIGARLSVDDFGTGYSSLTFLARFAVDEVKVDQEFVTRMAESREAAAIVRSTVELGRALGLRVIAEGVETAAQKSALAAMGCEAGQGYHFFPPMDADRTARVLWSLRESANAQIIPLPGRSAATGE